MIKVDEFQKILNLFELNWCEPISDDGDFLKVHADAVDSNEKAQIKDFLNFEHIFFNVHIKSEFLQMN